ncbi:hypothetical protein OQA88_1200 [Cercophora sp. LCS_1]
MPPTILPLRKTSWRGISSHEPPSPSSPAISTILTAKRLRIALLSTSIILLLLYAFPPASYHDQVPIHISNATISHATPSTEPTNWSQFAYIQYATNSIYLCNALVLFSTLHALSSPASRVLMFPSSMLSDPTTRDAQLILKARHAYNVTLSPIEIQSRKTSDPTWSESFTKLLAFNQTAYERVLSLDADALLLKPMDELFLLPPAPVAMPRAYWLYPEKEILSSQLMLVTPSEKEFARVMNAIDAAGKDEYDMEIVNTLYRDSALVIPHRGYDLLTREFMNPPDQHAWYLGSPDEEWDPVAVLEEAKFLHFSDWPVPKPWMPNDEELRLEHQPGCWEREGVESCAERELWNGFREAFRDKREVSY